MNHDTLIKSPPLISLLTEQDKVKIEEDGLIRKRYKNNQYEFKQYKNIYFGLAETPKTGIVINISGNLIGSFERDSRIGKDYGYSIYNEKNKEIGCYCQRKMCLEWRCGANDTRELKLVQNVKKPEEYILENYLMKK